MIFTPKNKDNRMFTRLKRLYGYFSLFGEHIVHRRGGHYSYIFDTKLGKRECIIFTHNKNDCLSIGFVYYDSNDKIVFEIDASLASLSVKPTLGGSLTAENVDLALYELEQHLLNIYGDIDEIMKNKQIAEKRQEETHNKELKKLL